jgi:phospholipid/cholesterol/gamma-HCH transport system permease protein
MTRFLEAIGRVVLRVFEETGNFFSMLGRVVAWAVRPPYDVPELLRQMVRVGFDSISVVFVTTLFTGMVLALQTFNGFARFHAQNLVGSVVALSLTRELAPVLTALMVTGRVGSAMAAELGTMRVTEQIDALTALGTEPVQYLIVPRVTASVVMMPLLVIMGDVVGIYGGYFVACAAAPVRTRSPTSTTPFSSCTSRTTSCQDHQGGGVRAGLFAHRVYSRLHDGGAEGVGRATTRAVVARKPDRARRGLLPDEAPF